MMGRRFFSYVIIASCFVGLSCDTDSNIDNPDEKYFIKMYGGDGDQKGVDMEILADGSVLMLGSSESENLKKILLMKVDATGKVLWEKKLGSAQEQPVDLEPAANGNFAIASYFETVVNGVTNYDVKILLVSADGTKLDSATNGSSTNNDFATSITALSDGGFIITSNTEEVLNGPTNTYRFRCNTSLDWVPNYDADDGSTGDYDYLVKVFEISPDLFYAFGTSDRIHPVNPPQPSRYLNMQYFSLSGNGLPGNNDAYTGSYYVDTKTAGVCLTPQSLGKNFAVLGTEYTGGVPTALRLSILRSPMAFYNSDVDELIDKQLQFGLTLTAVSVSTATAAPSGYLLLANEARNLGSNIWLGKIDQSANLIWSASLGSNDDNDLASTVKELPDGRILVLGSVSVGDHQTKMALFKLSPDGKLQE